MTGMSTQILNYHEISPANSDYLYSLPEHLFAEHVRLIASRPANSRPVEITFDDGHVSQYQHGLPALEKYAVKASFFVTVGWVGTASDSLSWAQLRELVALGHEVQAHGWSHKFLTQCSDTELKEELGLARLRLEEGLGARVDALSLPHGRWNARVLEACALSGYRRVYGSYPWFAEQARSVQPALELHGRTAVVRGTSGSDLLRLIEGRGASQWLPRLKYAAVQALRGALGGGRYHRLWCFLAHRHPEAGRLRGTAPPALEPRSRRPK